MEYFSARNNMIWKQIKSTEKKRKEAKYEERKRDGNTRAGTVQEKSSNFSNLHGKYRKCDPIHP